MSTKPPRRPEQVKPDRGKGPPVVRKKKGKALPPAKDSPRFIART